MKLPISAAIISAVISMPSYASPAAGGGAFTPPPTSSSPRIQASIIYRQYVAALTKLRGDGLALQTEDGGSLTASHHAWLDQRLARLEADFHRRLRNNNPLSVDSTGRPI